MDINALQANLVPIAHCPSLFIPIDQSIGKVLRDRRTPRTRWETESRIRVRYHLVSGSPLRSMLLPAQPHL